MQHFPWVLFVVGGGAIGVDVIVVCGVSYAGLMVLLSKLLLVVVSANT